MVPCVIIVLLFYSPVLSFDTVHFSLIESFPQYKSFGQLSAVSVDKSGNVYVFHRGNRTWDMYSFNSFNVFVGQDRAIAQNTIMVLEPRTGSLLHATGGNMFYMPHGLTVDFEDNVWVTDVALHQVFKFPPLFTVGNSAMKPLLTFGTALVPGNDKTHFCKPTDVAVDSVTGDFFISDGYCNSRVLKYNKAGQFLVSWGHSSTALTPFSLLVPHALTLNIKDRVLYVADRENGRILAYNSENGAFLQEFGTKEQAKVYSVAYSPAHGGLLFAVDAPSLRIPFAGVAYDTHSGVLRSAFAPSGVFQSLHDVALSPDGKDIYVVELHPYRLTKFTIDNSATESVGTHEKILPIRPPAVTVKKEAAVLEAEPVMAAEAQQAPVVAAAKSTAKPERQKDAGVAGTQLAAFVVSLLVLCVFLFFMFHLYKKRATYRRSEVKGLILDDYEEDPY